MNAVAGNDPEPPAITEVTGGETEQAAQAGPVGIGDGERCGQTRIARPIQSPPA